MKVSPRSLAVGVLSAALLIAAAPTAQARSLDRHLFTHSASWLDVALSWLSDQLVGAPQAPAAHGPQTKFLSGVIPPPQPMTTSCIDPNGAPRPCGGAGTGPGGV